MAASARSMLAVVALLLLAAQPAFSGQLVEHLPGYNGALPFKLETGYISVGDSEMFYYFVESEGDPENDPLMLWLTGGPGCSSVTGLLFENGPLEFKSSKVNLTYYAQTWTKFASVIFLDSPVGTGFSYSRTEDGWATSDTKTAEQAYVFLLKWLEENPKYLPLRTYITGDSYGGMIVPQITKFIIEGLEAQVQPRVNIKGYLLGAPLTDKILTDNVAIVFAHRMGLIPDDIYETLKESCNGNYVDVDPSNTKCVLALEQYNKCTKDVSGENILYPVCEVPAQLALNIRSLRDSSNGLLASSPRLTNFQCLDAVYTPSHIWANDPIVREALHVRKDTISEWFRCSPNLNYTDDINSVISIHRYLMTKELDVLIFNGDRDFRVTNTVTEKWIKSLNLTVEEEWRPWFVDGQVGGYTEKYSKSENGYSLVYATVKGAGHVPPMFYRGRCFDIFERWVHWYPL